VQITGDIVIGADNGAFADATAYVYLEDVSRVDASAQRIGIARLDGVAHVGGSEGRIPFVVAAADVPVTRDVVVRVHISVGGGEEISSGDLVSTEHISAEPDKPVDVPVRET
jgi:hypothetical protein